MATKSWEGYTMNYSIYEYKRKFHIATSVLRNFIAWSPAKGKTFRKVRNYGIIGVILERNKNQLE